MAVQLVRGDVVTRTGTDAGAHARRLVFVLSAAAFVESLGAGAILPLLPAYLRDHGSSATIVGLVMSAYFAAGLVVQYPSGRLGDRIGHMPVLVAGLLLYAVGSLGFVLHPGAVGYIALRGVQGAGNGAVLVAAFALIGIAVPDERRGRAFSTLFAGQLAGLGIGPLAGAAVGIGGMEWLFVATAVTSTVAAVAVVGGLPNARPVPRGASAPPDQPVVRRLFAGVLVTAVVGGLIVGTYETCWTMLLDSRGASVFQVGLSWTLFAFPFAAVSPFAGRLADRLDRRRLTIVAMLSTVGFCATYPYLHSVAWLIGLGGIEAVGVAISYPAAQALLAQSAPASALGRAQGTVSALQTGASALAAGIGGAMFGIGAWLPFVSTAVVSGILTLALLAIWQVRGPGPVALLPEGAAAVGAGHAAHAGMPTPALPGTEPHLVDLG
jgi:DHA1 family multidrug resistance protein-like MFS transporter